MKAQSGISTNEDARLAGREAMNAAKNGLDDVKLVYAYASCDYDCDELIAGMQDAYPGIPIIGNTSFTGVITKEGFVTSDKGFVGVMAVSDPDLVVGVAAKEKDDDAFADGEWLAKTAMQRAGFNTPPAYYYMAASSGEEEFYVKGITSVIGRVPFFGGSAADNTIEGNWKLYTDTGSFGTGAAVAFFYTDKKMFNEFTGAYHATKDMGIITKISGNRTLVEIDGVPAVKKYADWTGAKPDDLKGGALLAATCTSPLGVKDRLGDLTAIRHPMNGNDDYSMAIGNNLAKGTAVIRMEASVDELISSVTDTIEKLKKKAKNEIGFLHLVHCGGRRAAIDNRIDEVAKRFRESVGEIPFIVEFTFGEYGFEADGNNTCGGLMLSFTAFEK